MVDIDELKERFLNLEFDRKDFTLDPERMITVARQCGETRPEYVDAEHPEFQALPSVIASLASGRHLPIEFPKLGGIPMDGGKAVERHAPVRPRVTLNGRTHLHEIYAKQGRSGRMLFMVSRMEIYDAAGTHLATSDSRMVVRERPTEQDDREQQA
ncbi:MAG: MaoC family dehydratase N-terminal domain-containing protein [Pseudomonadota bacterium]